MEETKKEHLNVVIIGHVDAGKCYSQDTPILMANGTIKPVQNVKEGDCVMGDDSQPQKIIRCTQGKDQMYQIIQNRGDSYTVTSDHWLVLKASNYEGLWWNESRKRYRIRWLENFSIREKTFSVSACSSQERAHMEAKSYLEEQVPNRVGYTKYQDVVEIKAKDFYKLPQRVREAYKGFSLGVDFPQKDIPIDPYSFGYWLGDGTSETSEITTADPEIVEYFTEYTAKIGLEFNKKGSSKYAYRITTGGRTGGPRRNVFLNFLTDYSLRGNKHIPEDYKMNSRESRLKVLAGLLDSDGHYTHNTFDICLKSEQLIDDLIFVARSLGFKAFKKKVQKVCTNAPNGPKEGTYYRCHIYGEGLEDIPTLLPRKRARSRKTKKNASMTGLKIDMVGIQEYFGFTLEKNPRFLLGDFTVAHNSTLTGHLLFELGGLDDRTLEKLKEEAKALGKDSFSFAFFMDNKKAERERGITIDCNTKEFHTPKYHYSIIDAPGHRDFIKNMISGASQADVAVLMVPANRGGFETSIAKGDHKKNVITGQTRQHAQLAYLLGIDQIMVCVNKMDDKSVKYDKKRYDEIAKEVTKMLRSYGYRPKSKTSKLERFPVIALSGWAGDNLTSKSDKMPWYKGFKYEYDGEDVEGHTLLDALDAVKPPDRRLEAPFRMPVSAVLKIPGVGDVITGKIEQGTLKAGQDVVFSPSGLTGKIFSIEMHHRTVDQATPGYNIGVNVKGLGKTKLEKPKVGEVMHYKSDTTAIETVTRFQAMVLVQAHPGQLKCAGKDGKGGFTPVLHVRTAKVPCKMLSIDFKKGKSTSGAKVESPPFVEAGDQAVVWFEPQKPLYVEKFEDCPGLGRIAVMESNSLVMLGKILNVE